MNAVLQTIIMALSLIPSVIKAIQSLETLFPMSGAGKDKSDAVLAIVAAAGEGAQEMIPIVQKIINVLVPLCNKLGIFKKSE